MDLSDGQMKFRPIPVGVFLGLIYTLYYYLARQFDFSATNRLTFSVTDFRLAPL